MAFSYLKPSFVGSSSLIGGIAGKVFTPSFIAPLARFATRQALNLAWGPSKGFLSSLGRRALVEHVGQQAFAYSTVIGGTLGAAAGALAAQGASTAIAYGYNLYKTQQYLKEINQTATMSPDVDIKPFEVTRRGKLKFS